MNKRGVFITIEGVDGAGKSTQIAMLASVLQAAGYEVLSVRDPGTSVVSEKIREILLDKKNSELSDMTELFLYEAARSQMVDEIIEPALKRGTVVISDRFYDSTVAYQGYGRGLDLQRIHVLNESAARQCIPDRTIVLDLVPEKSHVRATREETDRLEAEGVSFQHKVREGFLAVAQQEPSRVRVVTADSSREEIHRDIMKEVSDLFDL